MRRGLLTGILAFVAPATVHPGPVRADVARAEVVRFDTIAVAWGGSPREATGWQPAQLPGVWHQSATERRPLALRFAFAGSRDGLALYSDRIRERYTVSLNGHEMFRSNVDASDRSFGWHRPLLLPLPPALVRRDVNVISIVVTADAGRPIAVGTLLVGPERQLRPVYRRNLFWTVTGPETVTGVMLILSAGALLFWIMRPREQVFGWLAVVGALWAAFNLQYFLDAAPFDDGLFWLINADTIFLVFTAALGFAATFLDVARRRSIIGGSAAVCLFGLVLRHGLIFAGRQATISYFIMWPVGVVTGILFARACIRSATIDNIVMLAATLVALAFGFHDLVLVATGWPGVGFQLQPYGGLIMFLAFGFALGRRVLNALGAVEDVNLLLERRVADATDQLRQSEHERQRLEVTRAIDGERERLMREIHDGIGSSLIRALSVARREQQSPNTIETLKRSIADLRIGVDSLEPIGGDVTMLLASFRHRTERDLNDAGLTFVWKSMTAPPIPWLDAVGALHILRILQEGTGNILKHANATQVAIDCRATDLHERAGVLITMADNGRGFDIAAPGGHGLSNMAARAAALNSVFTCKSSRGTGTTIYLWIPLHPVERVPANLG